MARCIDADSTIKAIRDKFNIYFEIPCDSDDRQVQEIIGRVKNIIQEQPTADVVPKSEVERLEHILDCYALQYGTVTEQQEVIDKAKAEVAREIFEEIEKCMGHDYISSIGVYNGALELRIAELKKKYVVETPIVRDLAEEAVDKDIQNHLEK